MRILYKLLALILIFLTSCQEETLIKQTEDLQQRVFTSLDKEENLAKALDKVSPISVNGRVASGLTEFKKDSILKVLQADSVSYIYTLASNESYSGKAFKNLVIRQVNGGYVGFILEYIPADIRSLFDIEHFTGTIRRYDLGNNLLIEIKLSEGSLLTKTINGRVNACENAIQLIYEAFDGTRCSNLWEGGSDGCEAYIYITSCGGGGSSGDPNFWTPNNIGEGTYFSGGADTNGSGSGTGNSSIYPETYRVLATQVPSLSGEAFANYVALEAWENDQILDGQLKPCMQTILGSIKNLSNGSVGQIIQKFAGTVPGYNWEVKDGTLTGGINANTSQLYNSATGTVTTIFDGSKFTNASDLSITRTILHESVHAYLVVYFRTDPLAASKSYPQLLQDYQQLQDANAAHHIEMTRSFVNDIAVALEEYGISKGYNLSSQFYQDMAWAGITRTSAFQSLSQTDQDRIIDTILIELTGNDSQGNSQSQKGTNAGC